MENVAQKVFGELLVNVYSSCLVKGHYKDIDWDTVQLAGTRAYGEYFSGSLPAAFRDGKPRCRTRDPVGALFAMLGMAGLLKAKSYARVTEKYPNLIHDSIPEALKRAGDYLNLPVAKQTIVSASLEEMADVLRNEGIKGVDSATVIHAFANHLTKGKYTDLLHDPVVSKYLQDPIGDSLSEKKDVLRAAKDYVTNVDPSATGLDRVITSIRPWSLDKLHQELSKHPNYAPFSEYLQTHGIAYPATQPPPTVPSRIVYERMEVDTTSQEIDAPHFDVEPPFRLEDDDEDDGSRTPKLPIQDLTELDNNEIKSHINKTDLVAWHKDSVEAGSAGFGSDTAEKASSSEVTFLTTAKDAYTQENRLTGPKESTETRLSNILQRDAEQGQTPTTSINPDEIRDSVFPRVAAEQVQILCSSLPAAVVSGLKHTLLVAAAYALDNVIQNVGGVSSTFATTAIYMVCAGAMAFLENPSSLARMIGSALVWIGAQTAVSTLLGTESAASNAMVISASLHFALVNYPSLVEPAKSLSAKFHLLAYKKILTVGAMTYDLHRPEGSRSVSHEVAQFVGRMADRY